MEIGLNLAKKFLGAIGGYIDIVATYDDMGTQQELLCSRKDYVKFIKPIHKKLFSATKKASPKRIYIFLHSCGSVYDLIPDFIEIGVDILNPVQTGAAKMDLTTLKREFGKDITFWGGGIDIQQQLPFFTLDEIEDEIKRRLDIMAPGGGHVFFPTHNIQADVTPDRIHHMYKTVIEYRDYKNFSPAHASDSL